MKPNEPIKKRRGELDLSIDEVANSIGLSIHEYDDLESYESELYDVVELSKIKNLCKKLDVDILSLFGFAECIMPEDYQLEKLLHDKRIKNNLSILDVSDHIGIEKLYVSQAEKSALTLNDWVVKPIIDYANILEITPACLIKSKLKVTKTKGDGGEENVRQEN